MLMNYVVIVLVCIGMVFLTGGIVGILRFPDFYSRLHAAGKLDTLGSLTVLLGLALLNLHQLTYLEILTSFKILLCMTFVFLASPTATHAIVNAGMDAGLSAWTKNRREG